MWILFQRFDLQFAHGHPHLHGPGPHHLTGPPSSGPARGPTPAPGLHLEAPGAVSLGHVAGVALPLSELGPNAGAVDVGVDEPQDTGHATYTPRDHEHCRCGRQSHFISYSKRQNFTLSFESPIL